MVLVQGTDEERKTPFLHEKHMQRGFLFFKEVSYSKQGAKDEDDEDGEKEHQA
jgi:hypothetical protein